MKKQTKTTPPVDDSQLQTRVLLEEIRSEVKIVGEQHGSIIKKLDSIDSKIIQHDEELQIIKAVAQANNSELKTMKLAVLEVDTKVNRVEKKLDTSIAQNEERFKRIETKVGIA